MFWRLGWPLLLALDLVGSVRPPDSGEECDRWEFASWLFGSGGLGGGFAASSGALALATGSALLDLGSVVLDFGPPMDLDLASLRERRLSAVAAAFFSFAFFPFRMHPPILPRFLLLLTSQPFPLPGRHTEAQYRLLATQSARLRKRGYIYDVGPPDHAPEQPGRQAPHAFPVKVGLPYLGTWSLKMQRLGVQYKAFFALSNKHTVLRAFPSAKVPMSCVILGGSVYQLTCECPGGRNSLYIGQSSVPIAQRMQWHEKDWEKGRGSFSAHKAAHGHSVGFDSVQIVAQESNYPVRILLEALHIMRLGLAGASLIANPNLENRDARRINKSDGIRLSPLWGPVAKKI